MKELGWLALKGIFSVPGADTDFSRHFPILWDRRLSRTAGGRSTHIRIPLRAGGIPIFYFLRDLCAVSFRALRRRRATDYLTSIQKLGLAATAIFATVGLIDDLVGLRPWQKLLGQLGAAGLAYWAGVRVLGVVGVGASTWWALPLTLFWLIACTNAFNLVDGLDGLAAGMGLVAALTLLTAALLRHNMALASAAQCRWWAR